MRLRIPDWHGVHHIALACSNLDLTLRFYAGVLGMQVIADGATPNGVKHAMVSAGDGANLHFWQIPGAAIYRLPAERGASIPGALQHLSFELPDRDALENLRERLSEFEIQATEIFQQGPVELFFFEDPDGTLLEATCWTVDPLTQLDILNDSRFFTEDDPVAAVVEIRAGAAPETLWKNRSTGE